MPYHKTASLTSSATSTYLFLTLSLLFSLAINVNTNAAEAENSLESPWLLIPTINSGPKLGSAVGFMCGYLKKLDKTSPVSMFGAMGSYSNTDSFYYGAFARTYFDDDEQRLTAALINGKINNNFEDFLGTGLPVSTTDSLDMAALRYFKFYKNNWYFGFQAVSTNYAITANDALSGIIIDFIGLNGHRSNALGLVANYDTRNNQNSPTDGTNFQIHNLAYRKSFGGNESFDAYTLDYATFLAHGDGNVAAFHAKGRWTDDAPTSGYSSVELRGYTRGEYLAPHMTLVEIDERIRIKKRWGATLSAGIAYLYGGKAGRTADSNLFPSAGVGLTFTIKEKEKMVVRTEYAIGKSDNSAFYLRFGQPF